MALVGGARSAHDGDMHNHIITGYDGSETSAAAVSWAADEAVRKNAGLTVIACYIEATMTDFGLSSVWPTSGDGNDLREVTQAQVDGLATGLAQSHPGLVVNAVAVHGRPQRELVEQAEHADLVVIGATGSSGNASPFMGSVARAVVRYSPCPTVVVSQAHTPAERPRVVVAVDGTDGSVAALDWAVDEADVLEGELEVVHAYSYPYAAGHAAPSEARDLLQVDAATQLERAVERARERGGSKVEGVLVEGRPANVILDRANGADLVVIGMRHYEPHSVYLAVLGSVAETIVGRPPCPVAVVRQDLAATPLW